MPQTTYKGYEIQTTGTNAGTWGGVLNDNMISYVDVNIGGSTTLSLASTTPVALTATQARNGMLVLTGALLANIAVTTVALGVFWVENRTTGAFYVSLSNGTGNVMLVPQGTARQVWSDTTYGIRALGLQPPGSFLDLGAASAHASMLATSSLIGEYLYCDGSAVSRTGNFANLFQALGTTWGVGDGSSTFNVPDLRGRSKFGRDDMGGSAANRITNAGSGIVGTTTGAVGGAQSVTFAQANLPNINFTVTDPGHVHAFSNSLYAAVGGIGTLASGANFDINTNSGTVAAVTGISVASGGSGTALNKMPPTGICNILIKI